VNEEEIEHLLDDLLAGKSLPAPTDGHPAWVRKLHRWVAGRDEAERQRALYRSAIDQLTTTLMRLAALEFEALPEVEITGDDFVDAAHLGLSMMAEELSAAQQALKNARDEAIAANRSKSSFLASMSHELRTPLNAIIGYCELASEDLAMGSPEEVQSDLRRILRAARHLLGMISDVLDLSKIEAGHMAVSMQPVEVGPVVREVGETVRHLAESNGNRLRLHLDDPLVLWADPARLRQVLFNLVGNAAKYTRNGTIDVEIRDEGASGWIEIRDSGIGISAEQMPRLFLPFVRLNEHDSSPGTGLGLAITERLCKMMGGTIEVSSTFGVGSTFRVCYSTRPPLEEGFLDQEIP
jgi:signal transduction histidine kinase